MMRHQASRQVRGFSLIELLMAIFILGIGLVSIAALFPAGIVLQQRGEDEFNGPVVADWAMGLLRDRLSVDDFGSWWDFVAWNGGYGNNNNVTGAQTLVRARLDADAEEHPAAWLQPESWPWLRPALIADAGGGLDTMVGAVDIFNATGSDFDNLQSQATTVGEHTAPTDGTAGYWQRFLSFDPSNGFDDHSELIGIPFNAERYPEGPPRVFIHRTERSWPPGSASDSAPQYYWDCAFRRIGRDRVQAAIFVYRVKRESMTSPRWQPQGVPLDNGAVVPPVPYRLSLADVAPPDYPGWAAGLVGNEDFFEPGGGPGQLAGLPGLPQSTQDIDALESGWQHRGQWLLDQNGMVHRVTAGRSANDLDVPVVLSAPIPQPSVAVAIDSNDEDGDGEIEDMRRFSSARALPPSVMMFASAGQCGDWPNGVIRDFAHNDRFDLGTDDGGHCILDRDLAAPQLDPWTGQSSQSARFAEDPPVVDTLWYIPPVIEVNGFRYELEPIYVAVEDL